MQYLEGYILSFTTLAFQLGVVWVLMNSRFMMHRIFRFFRKVEISACYMWGARFLITFLFMGVFFSSVSSAAEEKSSIRESIEWVQIYVDSANKNAKERVLLIGDSITNEYYARVCAALKGLSCAKFTTSASVANEDFFRQLNLVLSSYHFDYVHFNNGLHGFAYSENEYSQALESAVLNILKFVPEKNLVIADSTPLFVEASLSPEEKKALAERNRKILARNEIVYAIAKKYGLEVDYLHHLMKPSNKEYIDAYHHKKVAIDKLVHAVVAKLEEKL